MQELGVDRVVLARENTLDDIRAIHAAVPGLGLESFVHGALCIAYSGQCFMSGMISERSANRGSCAQSCRKDYVLTDAQSGEELDRGYLISAKDLGAYDHLEEIADAGIGCLKIEGRKKKPEYVATVTKGYREFLDRVEQGTFTPPTFEEVQPLVQIFSRGFTGGMYGGRAGRDYITRTQPDNHGFDLGVVVANESGEVIVDVSARRSKPATASGSSRRMARRTQQSTGFAVSAVRTISTRDGITRQAIASRTRLTVGWRVLRTAHAALLERARASFASLKGAPARRRVALDVRVFGGAGAPLKAIFRAADDEVSVVSGIPLAPATKRALDAAQLREQFGRLGDTPFALGAVDAQALAPGLFIPVSELNHLRQRAVDELMLHRDWAENARIAERAERGARGRQRPADRGPRRPVRADAGYTLSAEVFTADDARAAASAGANEIVFDPFLRHPAPPRPRVVALAEELKEAGARLRLRTPTIVRPADRPAAREVARARPAAALGSRRALSRSFRVQAATSSPTTR